MTAPALRLQGVSKHYGTVRAVDRVTLEVSPGEVYALLGLNGAGKTTVMRTVLGMAKTGQMIKGTILNYQTKVNFFFFLNWKRLPLSNDKPN